MYQILFTYISEDSTPNWSVLYDGFLTIAEACETLAEEIENDTKVGGEYAYRIIEVKA